MSCSYKTIIRKMEHYDNLIVQNNCNVFNGYSN